jgi:hypothetical protein
MATLGPSERWPRADLAARSRTDHYYDHAGDVLDPGAPILFEAAPGQVVGAVFEGLAPAWSGVTLGAQVMRPLVHRSEPRRLELRPSTARGGNVVFLDRDALLAAPFPSIRSADGVVTRRGDLLAALLSRDGPWKTVAVDLPLAHGRRLGDGSSPSAMSTPDPIGFARFVESQARGLAMARALEQGKPSATSDQLVRRRRLHHDGFVATRLALARATSFLDHREHWWWLPNYEAAAIQLRASLDRLAGIIPSDGVMAEVSTDVSGELQAFVTTLRDRADAWRRTWR